MRILIADDNAVIRSGIRAILQARPEWEVCGEAVNGRTAVLLSRELRPDIIIMDIGMPIMNGLEATEQLTTDGCDTRVLIFTLHESQTLREKARAVGACGYVVKYQGSRSLINALERLHGGGTFFNVDAKKPAEQTGLRGPHISDPPA